MKQQDAARDSSAVSRPSDKPRATSHESSDVIGISSDPSVVKLRLAGIPAGAEPTDRVFRELAASGIVPRSIARQAEDGSVTLTIVVDADAQGAFASLLPRLQDAGLVRDASFGPPSAPVSVIGSRLTAKPSIAARIFRALSHEGIDSECVGTSEARVWCLVSDADRHRALGALQAEFVEELAQLRRGLDHVI
jgi:aspartate kinase